QEIIGRRAGRAGHLFTGRKGNPWNRHSFYSRFKALRRKFPQLKGVSAVTARHSWATDALERGVPEGAAAELLGHANTTMLYRHYSKLSKKVQFLKDMAIRAAGCASAP